MHGDKGNLCVTGFWLCLKREDIPNDNKILLTSTVNFKLLLPYWTKSFWNQNELSAYQSLELAIEQQHHNSYTVWPCICAFCRIGFWDLALFSCPASCPFSFIEHLVYRVCPKRYLFEKNFEYHHWRFNGWGILRTYKLNSAYPLHYIYLLFYPRLWCILLPKIWVIRQFYRLIYGHILHFSCHKVRASICAWNLYRNW